MLSSRNIRRIGLLTSLGVGFVALSACSGGGNSGTTPVPITQFCGNDTQYALARPQAGQSIPAGISTVEIVANGKSNQIAQSFQNFDLLFIPTNNGSNVTTGSLSLSSDKGGFQPFTSDYYYNGTIASPGLSPGTVYNVYLNAFTSNCTPVGPIGTLGTP